MRFDCVIGFLCMGAVVYLTAANFVYPRGIPESRLDSITWLLEFKSICIYRNTHRVNRHDSKAVDYSV